MKLSEKNLSLLLKTILWLLVAAMGLSFGIFFLKMPFGPEWHSSYTGEKLTSLGRTIKGLTPEDSLFVYRAIPLFIAEAFFIWVIVASFRYVVFVFSSLFSKAKNVSN